jgi:protein-S-isoprenylcysteine O-methyltransferase Ste14
MRDLTRRAFTGLIELQVAMALLLFLPAGSLSFWQGWIYWTLFSVCVVAITLYFLKYDPHLIEGRLAAGPRAEEQTSQRIIQAIAAVLFFAVLIIPGLDYRFRGSTVPRAIMALGDVLLVFSLAIIFFVFKENSYAAGTIKVETGQRIISTGPYRMVRHPMYSGALILFLATPLALGSAWGLLVSIPLIGVLLARLMNEERYLSTNLAGYNTYRQQVGYRLLPFIW